jgi:hypothetical protein
MNYVTWRVMTIEWTKAETRYEYYYGKTASRFSAQIGSATNPGKYGWTIFHEDFRYCVHGGEADSIADAQSQAEDWLDANAKPPS